MAITGTGTQADPWVISTPQDLVDFSASTSYWASGTYAVLTADIDMDGVTGFNPIGNSSTKYQGNFDGQGHVISNLTINKPSINYVGLFGYTQGATISRIGCVGFDIAGRYNVGGLVGKSNSACTINGCTVENCMVTGSDKVAGLVGAADSAIEIDGCVVDNCIFDSSYYVGGLVGYAYSASISNCYAYDNTISGSSNVGGLVGFADAASISNCYAYDNTISGSNFVGGLVGNANTASISNCATYGGTRGNVLCGGGSSTVTNCYTSNDVSSATFHTRGFWDGTGVSGTTYLSWDFTTPVWYWDSTKNLPVLQPPSTPSAPAIRTKVAGSWKNIDKALVKVGGTWKQADKAFVKVGGAWKQT